MGRTLNRLKSKQVEALGPGRHADGGGLYLDRDDKGRSRWVFMWARGSVRREMGLGAAGKDGVSLAQARERAAEAREALNRGEDPIEARDAKNAPPRVVPTFGQMADEYVEAQKPQWRNDKHQAQWSMTLKVYAKSIRDLPVDRIGTTAVLGVLQPIWLTKSETASRLRGRIERVLAAAKVKGFRDGENPAAWRHNLEHLLPARKKLTRGHHAALHFKRLPDFIIQLRRRTGVAALALEFLILTAARSGEVLGATWAEVDLDAKVWTVPGERMKAGREHRVPLSSRAVAILKTARQLATGADWKCAPLFPGQDPGRPVSAMALSNLLGRMGVSATIHGFRSSFRDWAGEVSSHPREVAEAALAHTVGDATERAYRRGDALEKRRKLMDAWAKYIASGSAPTNVVPFPSVQAADEQTPPRPRQARS